MYLLPIVLSIACCLVIWNQQQSLLTYALVNTGAVGQRQQRQRRRQKSPFTTTPTTTNNQRQQRQQQRRRKIDGGVIRTSPDQRWEEIEGNYVLKPPSLNVEVESESESQQQQIRGIIHFLGGAFVGVAPHVSYRYMLERLASEGYLIIATPYNMSFDHLEMCSTVQNRFNNIIPSIKQQYGSTILDDGSTPIINVGHSCGSLLHLLMSTSLYHSTTRNSNSKKKYDYTAAANVFMSFNNKPAAESIPYFDELVTPISQYFTQTYYSDKPNQLNFIRLAHEARAVSDVGILLQGLEQLEMNAGRDFDFLLYEMKRAAHLMYNPINEVLPLKAPQSLPPSVFSQAAKFGLSGLLRPAKRTLQTMTLINQIVDGVDSQVPVLLKQISEDGMKDFSPAPKSIKEFAKRSYKSPKTLILQYEEDKLDESQEILQLLTNSHPTQTIQHTTLKGGHTAPLIAPPLHVATSAEKRLGQMKAKEKLGYAFADATVEELTSWLNQEVTTTTTTTTTTSNVGC